MRSGVTDSIITKGPEVEPLLRVDVAECRIYRARGALLKCRRRQEPFLHWVGNEPEFHEHGRYARLARDGEIARAELRFAEPERA